MGILSHTCRRFGLHAGRLDPTGRGDESAAEIEAGFDFQSVDLEAVARFDIDPHIPVEIAVFKAIGRAGSDEIPGCGAIGVQARFHDDLERLFNRIGIRGFRRGDREDRLGAVNSRLAGTTMYAGCLLDETAADFLLQPQGFHRRGNTGASQGGTCTGQQGAARGVEQCNAIDSGIR